MEEPEADLLLAEAERLRREWERVWGNPFDPPRPVEAFLRMARKGILRRRWIHQFGKKIVDSNSLL